MPKDRLPQQSEVDWEDPQQHFAWALSVVPYGKDVNQPMQPSVARTFSKHLVEAGFAHRDYIASLADESGYIHVDNLPKQKKRMRAPHRGQQTALNGSSVWVDMDSEDPDPVVLPDVAALTDHEQQLMVEELKRVGKIQDPPPDRGKTAKVVRLRDLQSSKIHRARDVIDNATESES